MGLHLPLTYAGPVVASGLRLTGATGYIFRPGNSLLLPSSSSFLSKLHPEAMKSDGIQPAEINKAGRRVKCWK